jgi:tetratricopeptide (TPR) repeat protein
MALAGDVDEGTELLVDVAARWPACAGKALVHAESLAKDHPRSHLPALAAARILEGLDDPVGCATWAARALQRGAPHSTAEELLTRQFHRLRESGRLEESLGVLDWLAAGPERMDWLLQRADVRRETGDMTGAVEDLREAESLASDPDEFLERAHRRRAERLSRQLVRATGGNKVRLLLDLGRWEEADRCLAQESVEDAELRHLRARLLVARGEPAAGLRLLRGGEPAGLMVDAAQRCDRPEVALGAVDGLLDRAEGPALRVARSRLLQEIWKRELDPGRQTLLARIPFQPRTPE